MYIIFEYSPHTYGDHIDFYTFAVFPPGGLEAPAFLVPSRRALRRRPPLAPAAGQGAAAQRQTCLGRGGGAAGGGDLEVPGEPPG